MSGGLKEKLRQRIADEMKRPAPIPGEKLWQEFYCTACHGYFMVKVNTAISGVFTVRCPNCNHVHGRIVEDGHIRECWSAGKSGASRWSDTSREIIVPKSAFSWTPRTIEYLSGVNRKNDRTCAVAQAKDQIADAIMRQSWSEKHGVKS